MQDVRYLAALIIGIVAFGIIISGATAFAQVTLNGFSGSAESIRQSLITHGGSDRTRMSPIEVCETALGSTLSFQIENTGATALHSFRDWDLIAFQNTSSGEQVAPPLEGFRDDDELLLRVHRRNQVSLRGIGEACEEVVELDQMAVSIDDLARSGVGHGFSQ